jgi:hypothetical protein
MEPLEWTAEDAGWRDTAGIAATPRREATVAQAPTMPDAALDRQASNGELTRVPVVQRAQRSRDVGAPPPPGARPPTPDTETAADARRDPLKMTDERPAQRAAPAIPRPAPGDAVPAEVPSLPVQLSMQPRQTVDGPPVDGVLVRSGDVPPMSGQTPMRGAETPTLPTARHSAAPTSHTATQRASWMDTSPAEHGAPANPATESPLVPRPPDVRITIGRVEVHAAPGRAVPARPAASRRPPLSLADYLAQRK